MASQIQFNSYNLQTSSIITERIFHTSTPQDNLKTEEKMRRNGSFLLCNYWIKKIINSRGHIIGSSVSDLDSRIDALKENLVGENLDLDIGYAGGTRRYRATVKKIEINREHFNGSWCPFAIEFICTDAFGKDTSTTSVSQDNNTTSPFSKTFTMGGSIGAYPIITLDFTSGNNVTAVKIKNTTTGDFITITRSFAYPVASLVIDCNAMTVEVDGIDEDFTGVFPEFIIGSNEVEVTVTGSPFDIDLDITYTKLYI